ncbi:hypothetical protein HDU93_000004 [Gonapodya sp. JEL0774]|nr:hypothetical protein HDU93_000004 [Gonapodya sp. JEL0774]
MDAGLTGGGATEDSSVEAESLPGPAPSPAPVSTSSMRLVSFSKKSRKRSHYPGTRESDAGDGASGSDYEPSPQSAPSTARSALGRARASSFGGFGGDGGRGGRGGRDDSGEETERNGGGGRRAGELEEGLGGTKVFTCGYPDCSKWFYAHAQLRAHTKHHEDRGEVLVETDSSTTPEVSEASDGDVDDRQSGIKSPHSRVTTRNGTPRADWEAGSATGSAAGSGGSGSRSESGKRRKVIRKMVALEKLTAEEQEEDVDEIWKGAGVIRIVEGGGVEMIQSVVERGGEDADKHSGVRGKDEADNQEQAGVTGEVLEGGRISNANGSKIGSGRNNVDRTSNPSSNVSSDRADTGSLNLAGSSTSTTSTTPSSTTARTNSRRQSARNRPALLTGSPSSSDSSDSDTEPRRSSRKSGGQFEESNEDGTLLVNGIDNFPRCSVKSCGKWFYTRASLKSHMRNHHGIEEPEAVIPPAPSALSVAIAGVEGLSVRNKSPSKSKNRSGGTRAVAKAVTTPRADRESNSGNSEEEHESDLLIMRGRRVKRSKTVEESVGSSRMAAADTKDDTVVMDEAEPVSETDAVEISENKNVNVDNALSEIEGVVIREASGIRDAEMTPVEETSATEYVTEGTVKEAEGLAVDEMVQSPMDLESDNIVQGELARVEDVPRTPGKTSKSRVKTRELKVKDKVKPKDDSSIEFSSKAPPASERSTLKSSSVTAATKTSSHRRSLSAVVATAVTRRNSAVIGIDFTSTGAGQRSIPKDDTFETLDEFPRCPHAGCEKWFYTKSQLKAHERNHADESDDSEEEISTKLDSLTVASYKKTGSMNSEIAAGDRLLKKQKTSSVRTSEKPGSTATMTTRDEKFIASVRARPLIDRKPKRAASDGVRPEIVSRIKTGSVRTQSLVALAPVWPASTPPAESSPSLPSSAVPQKAPKAPSIKKERVVKPTINPQNVIETKLRSGRAVSDPPKPGPSRSKGRSDVIKQESAGNDTLMTDAPLYQASPASAPPDRRMFSPAISSHSPADSSSAVRQPFSASLSTQRPSTIPSKRSPDTSQDNSLAPPHKVTRKTDTHLTDYHIPTNGDASGMQGRSLQPSQRQSSNQYLTYDGSKNQGTTGLGAHTGGHWQSPHASSTLARSVGVNNSSRPHKHSRERKVDKPRRSDSTSATYPGFPQPAAPMPGVHAPSRDPRELDDVFEALQALRAAPVELRSPTFSAKSEPTSGASPRVDSAPTPTATFAMPVSGLVPVGKILPVPIPSNSIAPLSRSPPDQPLRSSLVRSSFSFMPPQPLFPPVSSLHGSPTLTRSPQSSGSTSFAPSSTSSQGVPSGTVTSFQAIVMPANSPELAPTSPASGTSQQHSRNATVSSVSSTQSSILGLHVHTNASHRKHPSVPSLSDILHSQGGKEDTLSLAPIASGAPGSRWPYSWAASKNTSALEGTTGGIKELPAVLSTDGLDVTTAVPLGAPMVPFLFGASEPRKVADHVGSVPGFGSERSGSPASGTGHRNVTVSVRASLAEGSYLVVDVAGER